MNTDTSNVEQTCVNCRRDLEHRDFCLLPHFNLKQQNVQDTMLLQGLKGTSMQTFHGLMIAVKETMLQ